MPPGLSSICASIPEAIRLVICVLQGLAVDRDVLVQDHQVDRQALHPPVGVRLDQLPDDLDLLRGR